MTIPSEIAAYLAGAIDSDGSIGIRRSTYSARHGEGRQATYSERITQHPLASPAISMCAVWEQGGHTATTARAWNGRSHNSQRRTMRSWGWGRP